MNYSCPAGYSVINGIVGTTSEETAAETVDTYNLISSTADSLNPLGKTWTFEISANSTSLMLYPTLYCYEQ
jgi:hypothetical protein